MLNWCQFRSYSTTRGLRSDWQVRGHFYLKINIIEYTCCTKKYKTACVQEVQLGDLVYQHRPSKIDKLVVNN